jgi:hypothetical protein
MSRKNIKALKSIKGIYLLYETYKSRRLRATGTQEGISLLENQLEKYLMSNQETKEGSADCNVCFNDIVKLVTLLNCSHTCCENCLVSMVNSQKDKASN